MPVGTDRWEAYVSEFPFLTKLVQPKGGVELNVERVDGEFLARTRGADSVFIFDEAGEIILNLDRVPAQPGFKGWLDGFFELTPQETVIEAVRRLYAQGKIARYVVVLNTYWGKITIHRAPKKMSIKAWADELVQKQKNTLQEEIHQIDLKGQM